MNVYPNHSQALKVTITTGRDSIRFTIMSKRTSSITVFTGFLGAGKTTVILSLLKQLPSTTRTVLLKNEFGDIEGKCPLPVHR